MKHKDGSTIWGEVHARITSDSSGRSANILGICRDITDRKKFEEEQEKIIEILKLIKQARSTMDLTRIVTNYIRSWLGIDAVGIRLRDGDDYPYYETKGFPEQFVAAERYLCARDIDGNLIRDYSGSPVLDCMCGNVILGKFDPSKPFFTEKGSFWTNSTSELLASTTEEDRLTRTRNRCNGEGYESVALVPLRAKGETYGLIQLNGVKKNRFTSRTISLMDRIADHLALAVSELQVNDALS